MSLYYVAYSGSFLDSTEKFPCIFNCLEEAREFAREKAKDRAVVLIYKDDLAREDIHESFKCGRHYDKDGKLIRAHQDTIQPVI